MVDLTLQIEKNACNCRLKLEMHDLFAIAGRITLIYMNNSRQ